MPVALLLPLLAGHGGAVSGGNGFYDPRSWLVTFTILALLVAFGWLLRRPARRRRRGRLPATDRTVRTDRSAPGHDTPRRPVAPDDDEEFLRRLDRRNGPG